VVQGILHLPVACGDIPSSKRRGETMFVFICVHLCSSASICGYYFTTPVGFADIPSSVRRGEL
jgi:hypothetical protein